MTAAWVIVAFILAACGGGGGGASGSSAPATLSATVVAAGADHTCGVRSGGTVSCWGANHKGQLGNGTTTIAAATPTPVAVSYLDSATTAAAGTDLMCALLSNKTIQCWGDNAKGQLGNNTATLSLSSIPTVVSGIETATHIEAGWEHACARLTDTTVKCWGRNDYGQLGDGTGAFANSFTPVTVSGVSTATMVAAGIEHACARLNDGTVKCWGRNQLGQVGNGAFGGNPDTPVTVSGLTSATAVVAGYYHTCALISDATVQCWGSNGFGGQLGNGSTSDSATPVSVSGIASATTLAAGDYHTCARLTDGTVTCWGNNGSGRLGNGTTTSASTPVTVTGITTASSVTAGATHTCAVLLDGAVKCWGRNSSGQLGNGSTTDSSTPVSVLAGS